MILETKRLILRHYRTTDKPALARICSDNEIMRFIFEGAIPIDEFDNFVNKYFANANTSIGLGTLCLKDTSEIIGFSGLHLGESGIEFGFVLARDFRRKGYATEIGKAQIEFGKSLGYLSVHATVHPANSQSIQRLEKLGLVKLERIRIDRGERIVFTTMT